MSTKYLDHETGQMTTIKDYAARHGMSYVGVWTRVKKYGKLEGNVDAFGHPLPHPLKAMFDTGGIKVPLEEYAKAIGTSKYSLQRWKKKYGTYDGYVRYHRSPQPPKTFATLDGNPVGLRQWARDHGFSFSAVYHWAKRHNGTIDGFHITHHRRGKADLTGGEVI